MMADLIPFDPKKHKPISTVGGRSSTEYLASEQSPEGKAWNAAKNFEDKTGKKFPRFETIALAVEAAKARSKKGGASKKSLLKADD